MQKPRIRNPTPSLHQLFVQQRNLPGRPAKADEAHLQPKRPGLAQADGGWGGGGNYRVDGRLGHSGRSTSKVSGMLPMEIFLDDREIKTNALYGAINGTIDIL